MGFATLNGVFHQLTGVNMLLYHITDWLGLVPVAFGFGFAIWGLVQWIKRRILFKVDRSILALGGFYIVTLAAYLFFEDFVINYRPVLMIANNTIEADDAAAELHSGAYDGIFIGTHTSWQHSDFRVPVVMQEFGQCDINIDLQAAGRMAAEHMLQQGYGKLVFFSIIPYWTVDRKFAGAVEAAGSNIKHIIADCESDPAQTLLNELDLQKRTGIICSDDILAARLVNLLRAHSIDIPQQVVIIVYGGYHYGSLVDPVLTTLAYPAQEMAVKVANLLIDKVKNNIFSAPDKPLSLVPQLKVGGTTSSGAAEIVFNDAIKELFNQVKK